MGHWLALSHQQPRPLSQTLAGLPALPKGEPLAQPEALPHCQGLSLWERWHAVGVTERARPCIAFRPQPALQLQVLAGGGKGGDHGGKLLHHALVVVGGGGFQRLQLLVELRQVDGAGACHKNFVVLGAAHLVLLLVHHQLFVELLAGAQAHHLDLHVHARLVAVKADELLGKVHDLDRLPHVQHIDVAAFGQGTGLQHQLGRLRDGHEVALDVLIGQGDRAALFDLGFKQRDDAAVAAQHVAEPHRHTLHVGVARKGLDEHLADALGAAHDAGGVDGLVGGQLHEPLHPVLAGAHQQVLGAQHVVLDRLGGADLHQRHMLVGRRVEHHRGVVGLKHLVQPLFVPDGADEHGHRDIAAVLLLQFHLQLVGAVLVDVKDEQLARVEAHHLPAQLRADGAAAARHQHRFAGEVAGDLLHVQRHLVAGQKVRRVQFPESYDFSWWR